MEHIESFLSNMGGLAGVGVLMGGLGIAYAQFKSGSVKDKDDLIRTLKETAMAEKDKAERLAEEKVTLVTSHQTQINELSGKVVRLQTQIESAEKRNREMLLILQGRSPEQLQYMKDMREFTLGVAKYMKDSSVVLSGMKDFLANLNDKTDKIEKRNLRIDNEKEVKTHG